MLAIVFLFVMMILSNQASRFGRKLKNKLIRVVFKKDYHMKLVSLAQCKKSKCEYALAASY